MTSWRRARLSARRLTRLARPDSLRGRLMLSMLGVLVLGTAAASSLDEVNLAALLPRALSGRRLGGLGLLLQEPYQDITVLVAFSLMMLLLIWLVSGWSLAPLRRASQEAAAVGPGREARISPDGMPSEIRPLILAFNGALDRLAAAYALEQRFTADAAHELRTPLAVLDLRLQRARAQGRVDVGIDGELAQLKRVVGQLFDLARKEQAPPVAGLAGKATVNLSRAAREAAATVSLLIDAAGRDLVVDLPPRLDVPGRAEDLRDMVRNLLDNALAHGAGRIRLSARLAARQDHGPAAAEALLEVSDEGEGVAADLAPGMFERFRKGRSGSPGSGLGLAIVSEVARSHGGSVGFAPGAGCRVQVRLPAAWE